MPNSRNIFTRSGKSSTPVMFSESAIDQHLLDNPTVCAPKTTVINKIIIFSIWSFLFSFICFRSSLHQIMQAKFMPLKRICLQLETLALITCCDAIFNQPIIRSSLFSFITKSIKIFFLYFRRLSPDECRTKSLEMSFLLVIFKFCTTTHLFR